MNHARWNRRNSGKRLAYLYGTNDVTRSPSLQHIENELDRYTGGKRNRSCGQIRLIGEFGQLSESPGLPGGKVAQSNFPFKFVRDAAPALVQHCQFTTRFLISAASLMCSISLQWQPSAALSRSSRLMVRRTWPLLLLIFAIGCASPQTTARAPLRPFVFGEDTFAFANELLWHYEFDPISGKTKHSPERPRPDYTHHCFVVARSARQFFDNARFDASALVADEQTYRRAVRKIIAVNPRHRLS